ncbi:hypothetical protein HZU73_08488 [Apis mellifera caucasica]|nr:hypothetical protein HZU73_08488 [Apis mellifera caucasica]
MPDRGNVTGPNGIPDCSTTFSLVNVPLHRTVADDALKLAPQISPPSSIRRIRIIFHPTFDPSNVNAIQISDNLLQKFENLYVVEDEDSIQKKKK